MRDEILITGGSGHTGSRLVANLRSRGMAPRVAHRNPKSEGTVRFDWLDASTFEVALQDVRAAYLVAPTNATHPLEAMQSFLEQAIGAGVERFVLLSASILEEGGPMMGEVHAWLKQNAPHWTVLRPTWFMQNFSEQQHLPTICDEGLIYSATGQGRVPFIDAGDVAAVAAQALLEPDFPDRDLILTGPQTLSYDEVAQILSQTTGRKITHQHLTESQLTQRFTAQGIAPGYAKVLAAMDTAISNGSENRVTDEVRSITGRAPMDFLAFAKTERAVWIP